MDRYYKKRFVPLALPALILFVMVIVIPFIMGVIYSFTAWRGTYFAGGDHFWEAFVGFDNYVKAFKTKKFLDAFVYTIKVTLVAVVAINVVSLAMALLATSLNKGAAAYRTIYFLPNLLGGLALGYIWQFIFEIVFSKILFGEDDRIAAVADVLAVGLADLIAKCIDAFAGVPFSHCASTLSTLVNLSETGMRMLDGMPGLSIHSSMFSATFAGSSSSLVM